MNKLKKIIRKCPSLFFLLYKLFLPIKKIKNKELYNSQYNEFLKSIKGNSNNKIFYIGVPVHNNLGDLAQYYCIKLWLKNNYGNYSIIEINDHLTVTNYKSLINTIKNNITADDFFVFQSGYRTTDVANFEGEYAHQKILKNFTNKVLVFPQTVNFETHKESLRSAKAYKANNNYLFLARDEISFKSASDLYDKNRVMLYPDIVTSLIGNCNLYNQNQDRDGILLCLRNDDEKLYSSAEYAKLIEKIKTLTNIIDITDTNSDKNFELDRSLTESEISKKLEQFSHYKLIITDRYHGTIFSLVSNTTVIVLNSTDHKLSSGVKWFKGVYDNFVHYSSDLNGVYSIAENIYSNENKTIIPEYFNTKYYSELKNNFEKIGKR